MGVFFDSQPKAELGAAEIEQVRMGFRKLLVRKRFSPQFIAANHEELLAIASCEYVRQLAVGAKIEDPAAWIIQCAWQRTKNLLRGERKAPPTVSTEKIAELGEAAAPISELVAEPLEQARRAERVRAAIEELGLEERSVIALIYFEDLSSRQAARALGWSHSRVVRFQRSALRSLQASLGVSASEELAIDVALAAALAIGSDSVPRPGLGMLVNHVADLGTGLWGRAQELARRLGASGGSDTAAALGAGGAGRAGGICGAAVAMACLAGGSGLLPSLGVDPGSHREVGQIRAQRISPAAQVHDSSPPKLAAPPQGPPPPASPAPPQSLGGRREHPPEPSAAPGSASSAPARLPEAEFGAEATGAGTPMPTLPNGPTPGGGASEGDVTRSSAVSGTSESAEEFGL
jgi:RNA polymerase sigma factor (sigma-70 family)